MSDCHEETFYYLVGEDDTIQTSERTYSLEELPEKLSMFSVHGRPDVIECRRLSKREVEVIESESQLLRLDGALLEARNEMATVALRIDNLTSERESVVKELKKRRA